MIINDAEFGEVIVRKNPLSKSVRFSVAPSGRLQMSVPSHTSDFLAKRFLSVNRALIREKIPLGSPETQRARDAKKKILMKRRKNTSLIASNTMPNSMAINTTNVASATPPPAGAVAPRTAPSPSISAS